MKKLVSVFVILLFFIGVYSLAVQVNLDVSPKIGDINNPIKFTLSIENDESKRAQILEIKGLNYFDVIGQNTMDSISSEIKIINGKQENKTILHKQLILILQAKKPGSYTVGPAIIKVGNKTYKSNMVKIKITGARIMIGASQSNISNQQSQNLSLSETSLEDNIKKQNLENITKVNNLPNKNITIIGLLLIIILLGVGIITYVLYYLNKVKDKKLVNNSIKESLEETYSQTYSQGPLGFLEKYGIRNPETKTYSEIMKEVKEKNINLSETEREILEKELIEKFIK